MRANNIRWYATLLRRSVGTTMYVRRRFPKAIFRLEKRTSTPAKMVRHIHFTLEGKKIVFAQSVVDLEKSHPLLVKQLRTTTKPIGELVKKFHVRRTRLRSTTRSREFHFTGDLRAKIVERYYMLPKSFFKK